MQVAAFDVSKDELVYWSWRGSGKLPNNEREIVSFLKGLPAGSTVAMEATGRYHRLLAHSAYEKGFRVIVANPRRVSAFVRSTSARGKTDRTDARALELYVQSQNEVLRTFAPASELAEQVQELTRERQRLIDAKASLSQSLLSFPEAVKPALEGLDLAIERLEKELDIRLRDLPEYALLLEVPGVGPIVAAGFLSLLMSHDFATADSFVAYLGLDPKPSDSGTKKGKRYLSSQGHALARRFAFLAGMAGKRTKAWKDYTQKQKDKGLSGTETTLILGRKIARTAWSIYTHKQPFKQERIHTPLDKKS